MESLNELHMLAHNWSLVVRHIRTHIGYLNPEIPVLIETPRHLFLDTKIVTLNGPLKITEQITVF